MPDGKPLPYLAEPFLTDQAQFSPDGRWTAYVCNESRANQISVQSFPIGSGRRAVATSPIALLFPYEILCQITAWRKARSALWLVGSTGGRVKHTQLAAAAEESATKPCDGSYSK